MHVLLPTDVDTERALAAATEVLSLPNAAEKVSVTILNVQKDIEVTGVDGGNFSSEEFYSPEDFPESVLEATALLEEEDIHVRKHRELGDPATTIVETASGIGADRILMAGRKHTKVGKVLFGSVTQSVLLNAETPVTVIPT
jgi:nucleotide-binding universal stress UspA family protein